MSDKGFSLPTRTRCGLGRPFGLAQAPPGVTPTWRVSASATAPRPQTLSTTSSGPSPSTPATAIAGLADTRHDAVLVGGPSVDPATPVSVTVPLRAATYYFFDFNDFFTAEQQVTLHRMRVVGDFQGHAPRAYGSIRETMVRRPCRRSAGLTTLPATADDQGPQHRQPTSMRCCSAGSAAGTSDDDVQAYYSSGSTDAPPYALEAPLRGVAAMNPRRVAYVRFPQLKPGRYSSAVLRTRRRPRGCPTSSMGMHRVLSMRLRKGQ